MNTSIFDNVRQAPRDPILGVTEQFQADPNPAKVNLGVGVYSDANGVVPVLECVQAAARRVADDQRPCTYLPIDGLPAYTAAVKALVLGGDEALMARSVTVQGLGGTGALRVGAEFLKSTDGVLRTVLLSTPSWENHEALFTRAGFEVGYYPYYAADGVDAHGMVEALRAAEPGTVVVLHACCHNPTGCDLTPPQWDAVADVIAERGLIPFVDMAYQGFSQGLDADRAAVDVFVRRGLPLLVANSFSKSFSLYGERVGALTIVAGDDAQAARIASQAKVCVRTLYSNPPTYGARLVSTVLTDPDLRPMWEAELAGMRTRIKDMRAALADRLTLAGVSGWDFVERQVGMFSYTGLSQAQMRRMRDEFSVYGTDAGRLCMAALNERNLDQASRAIAAVV